MTAGVVLVLAGRDPLPGDVAAAVDRLGSAGTEVTVVARSTAVSEGTAPLPATVIRVDAGRFPEPRPAPLPVRLVRHAGRVVLRSTPSARFARAALANPDVMRALRGATVVVAGDSSAIETVWRAARRVPDVPAVNGVPAALRALQRQREGRG